MPKKTERKTLNVKLPYYQYSQIKRFRNQLQCRKADRDLYYENIEEIIKEINLNPINFWKFWDTFYIPKKSGGQRRVFCPCSTLQKYFTRYLRMLQTIDEVENYLVENNILEKTNIRMFYDSIRFPKEVIIISNSYYVVGETIKNSYSYGFEKGKNIVMNAKKHKDNQYFLKMDIKSAFPSIKKKSIFQILYFYEKKLESLLPILDAIIYNRTESLFVSNFPLNRRKRRERNKIIKIVNDTINTITYNDFLITGASLSPFILNHYLYKFDKSVSSYCQKNNLTYTRYADDITISGNKKIPEKAHQFIRFMLKNWGMEENTKKTCRQSHKRKNVITGIVVSYDEKTKKGKVGIGYKRFNELKKNLYLMKQGKLSKKEEVKTLGMLSFLRSVDLDRYKYLEKKYNVKI